MATKKVTLYFENERDALRFTVAAGSVMADGDGPDSGKNLAALAKPLARATRIRIKRTASEEDQPQAQAS